MNDPKIPPTRFCDLVMKGGVTSGVVYPLAAAKLSEAFIFKNIGGTSAGAIAAAATAVAESTRAKGGFERLKALTGLLTETAPGGGQSNLFAFFQPQPETRRLYRMCVAGLGGGAAAFLGVSKQIAVSYWFPLVAGAAPGLFFLICAWQRSAGGFLAFCCIVGGLLLLAGAAVGIAWAILRDVADRVQGNFYGMCTGMTADFFDVKSNPPKGKSKPLTYWLTEYFNSYWGRGPSDIPLTFGDLWGTRDPGEPRAVNLEMMTTCLTHGRPYRLPFREDDDVRENSSFYFRQEDFERLFPKSVVDWMAGHPRAISSDDAEREKILGERGFLPLPEPADLPLVVAVRMSLSFPVLLSAVPLYAINWIRDPDGKNPERCWFSDGGVCSNFPIHFFDSPLPRWPTLSINLVEEPEGTPAADLLTPDMPKTNGGGVLESWNLFEVVEVFDPATRTISTRPKSGFGKMAAFGGAFIDTMQNWTDNVQSRLPGYRDRIAAVGLTPDEGGLNLNMPVQRINDLSQRGEAVGEEFIRRFGFPAAEPKMNWSNHRWLRMRTCLASMEEFLAAIDRTCANPQAGDEAYEAWIAATPPAKAPGYEWVGANQRDVALRVLRSLRGTAADAAASPIRLDEKAPHPKPELRPRPRV